ncbi:MAG: FkbM family methyltransferase [Pseudomonadota bacterium]
MSKLNRSIWLALRRLLKGGTYRIHGIDVTVPNTVDQEIRYGLARGRPYEEPEARFVTAYLKEGMHVIELGGSIGVISALSRKIIGPSATQIIVEANPELAKICHANAAMRANPGTCETICAAVDYSGAKEVAFDFGHNAHAGRVADGGANVPIITLATIIEKLPEGDAALICDIEGGELALVAEDQDALKRFNLIIMEFHPHLYPARGQDAQKLKARIAQSGFQVVAQEEDVVVFTRAQ